MGGSSSVLAVGGSCARGNIAIWDTLAPRAGGPVAVLGTHSALVTALQARTPVHLMEGVAVSGAFVVCAGGAGGAHHEGALAAGHSLARQPSLCASVTSG